MEVRKLYQTGCVLLLVFCLYACGADAPIVLGTKKMIKLPPFYAQTFEPVVSRNRSNNSQYAKIYANDMTLASYLFSDEALPGSMIVMEIYDVQRDSVGNVVTNADGSFVEGDLIKVVVMEKRASEDWPNLISEDLRLNNWGFESFRLDGAPEGEPENISVDCIACHSPLNGSDYLFSFREIRSYARNINNWAERAVRRLGEMVEKKPFEVDKSSLNDLSELGSAEEALYSFP